MVVALIYLLVAVLGLIVGSFLSALSYRLPKKLAITKGRSFCDKCGKKISWYDNIPIFSYYILKGKCRYCKDPISIRYPLIEFVTLIVFLYVAYVFLNCSTLLGFTFHSGALCEWHGVLNIWSLPYLLIISAGFIIILVTDLEHELILDGVVYSLFILTLLIFITLSPANIYLNLLTAFAASLFLLVLHLVTRGKGMGLGDVKLALLGGIVLGWPGTLVWLVLSFIIGGFVGSMLIVFRKADFGKQIPFGPFLVFSFFIALVWGDFIFNSIIR
jgi:leader peptidase (prepilin peptidase)/N-methyltransferase